MVRRLGPYTLLRQIASGGMAEVYLASARSDEVERRVALKLIHAHSADDPELVSMLVEEARLALQLQHPNIVATYDLGHERGEYYIVMELVEGMDLFRALQRAAERDIDFPFELGAFIAREVASGLDYAHRRLDPKGQPLHVVHRDVSPHNVLLSYGGEVKLGDFGIAKAARRAAQTQAGVIKGKYAYMSPEQAWGDPIDARTDIFSAGILLYEMLAGQMLYLEEELERLLELVRKAEIAPPGTRRRGVPRDLEQIVMKALRRRPSDRYTTAGDYAQALTDFLRGYAPTFNGPQQLGVFLERLAGPKEPQRRRGADEPTAALPRPRSFGGPLVQDQNSLLFPSPAQTDPSAGGEDDEFGGATYVDEGPAALRELLGAQRAGARLDEDDRLGSEPTALVDDLPAPAPAAPRPAPAPARPTAVGARPTPAPTAARPTPAPASTRPTPAPARPATGTAPAMVGTTPAPEPARPGANGSPAATRTTPAPEPARSGATVAPAPTKTTSAPAQSPPPAMAKTTPAPAQPAATARTAPAPAQPAATTRTTPAPAQPAATARMTPAPAQPAATARMTPAPAQPAATARMTPAPAQPAATAVPRPTSPSGAIAPRLTPAPARARGPEAGAPGEPPAAGAKGAPPREPSPPGASLTPASQPPEPGREPPRETPTSEPLAAPASVPPGSRTTAAGSQPPSAAAVAERSPARSAEPSAPRPAAVAESAPPRSAATAPPAAEPSPPRPASATAAAPPAAEPSPPRPASATAAPPTAEPSPPRPASATAAASPAAEPSPPRPASAASASASPPPQPRAASAPPTASRPATSAPPVRDTAAAPALPPERLPRARGGGLVLGFLAAMALGAGAVLAVVLWPSAPARGQLEVRSAPSGATVLIDGRAVDAPTPVRILDLARDRAHRVTVRLPGYRTWEDEIRFQGEEQSRAVQAILEKQ